MKNFTFLALAVISLLTFSANAQQVQRCITDEKMQELFQKDPQAKIRHENTKRMLDAKVAEYLSNPLLRLTSSNAIINVPVVVHIALSDPNLVTNTTVQNQIDTLNWYYGGQSATDSLRVYTPFRTRYGRSQIRFCLAQRTPTNQPTNGINRITTTTTFSSGGSHPSTVAPAWNTNQYLNIWVVSFGNTGILGYSYYPGAFPAGDQRIGFVNDYRAFGSGASYLFSTFNMGKTAVHEIGHYFNIAHTWASSNSPDPTCTLDDGFTDTPNTNGPYTGCPTSVPVTSTACADTGPDGIMWQNIMDYSDDACMILFTKQQVTAMDVALLTAPDRIGLLTSPGCQPIVASNDDAGISAILSPTAGSIFCSPGVTPQVTLRNYGINTLTTVNISLTINGVVQAGYPYTWNGSLAQNATANLTLPAINLVSGSNSIVVSTSAPNGGTDGNPGNNSSTVIVSRPNLTTLPVSEGFEGTTFPPPGWTINNPDGGTTWIRYTTGTAASGTAMTRINYYSYSSRPQVDELILPPLDASAGNAGNRTLSFARSYRQYGTSTLAMDTLEILVSPDCGATYTSVWKKWGPTLATVTPSTTASFTPASVNDWVTESINLTPYATNGMIVKFKGTNRYGNNLHLDNINIQIQPARDLTVVSVNTPGNNYCSPNLTPSITVRNNGMEAITNFSITYTVTGSSPVVTNFPLQNLATGASLTIPLNNTTVNPGNVSIQVCVVPNSVTTSSGTGDQQSGNDCVTKAFTVVNLRNPPVVEGFEGAFPPTGWVVINPNNNNTWVKRTPGRNSQYSAFIDFFNFSNPGQTDDIRTPFMNVSSADSIFISFDLAHKNYTGANDTLAVLVSTDCGNTFTSVYKKWGATLATAGSSTSNYTAPVASDWRNESIRIGNTFTASGSVVMLFRATNDFGNNIFVDNINIATLYKRDAQLVSINQPGNIVCNGSFTPNVTVRNMGSDTITGLKVSYSINNGAPQTTTLTGLSLARNAQTTVNLTPVNLTTTGAYNLRVYTWDPVTASGTGDQNTIGDTLTKVFSLAGSTQAPLTESFSGTTVPPAGWSVLNPDNSITWSRYGNGNGNPGSAFVNTYNYPVFGQRDELVSPNVNFTGADSVKLTFDVAAATYSYPGSTTIPMDTLEVVVSKDCGATFTTVYKKWGEDLQTVNDPNMYQTNEFLPGQGTWRKETIDLTSMGSNGPLMVFFRITSNYENNIFIDNVNLSTRVLPDQLKQKGYLILPTPFQNSFGVWHLQTPSTLKYINVYNAAGQLVWSKQFGGNAQKMEMVDLSGKAAGVYIVNVGYEDANRNTSERVVKQ